MDLTKRETQIISELLNNSRISDQTIAKKIGTSRPTVSKIRRRLENRIIKAYTAHVDFEMVDYQISALTFFRWDDFSMKKELDKVIDHVKKNPQVISFSTGQGVGSMTHVITSVHLNMKDYEQFWTKLQELGAHNLTEVQVFFSNWSGTYKMLDITSPLLYAINKDKKKTRLGKS